MSLRVTFVLEKNDDKELTCILCAHPRACEMVFVTFINGKRAWNGIHMKCAEAGGIVTAKVPS